VVELLDPRFGAYVAVSAVLIVTPGPDTALVTRNALRSGRRAASITTFGIGAGSLVWAVASVLGVAVLLDRSVVAFTVFKLAGAAYLGYLGVRSLIGSLRTGRRAPVEAPAPRRKPLDDRGALRQGLVGNLLNPKAGAIFATVMPQFISPGDGAGRFALMLLAYETILLTWLHVYGYLVSRAGQSRAGARVRRGLEGVTGVILVGLGIRLALERR
jgi:threonine/homoserine/homoserine lactone efflux protein